MRSSKVTYREGTGRTSHDYSSRWGTLHRYHSINLKEVLISDRLIQRPIKKDGPCRISNVFVDQNFSMGGILQKFEVESSGVFRGDSRQHHFALLTAYDPGACAERCQHTTFPLNG